MDVSHRQGSKSKKRKRKKNSFFFKKRNAQVQIYPSDKRLDVPDSPLSQPCPCPCTTLKLDDIDPCTIGQIRNVIGPIEIVSQSSALFRSTRWISVELGPLTNPTRALSVTIFHHFPLSISSRFCDANYPLLLFCFNSMGKSVAPFDDRKLRPPNNTDRDVDPVRFRSHSCTLLTFYRTSFF